MADIEIIEEIRSRFDRLLASNFLDEAGWLMEALSFTHLQINADSIPEAWEHFQNLGEFPQFTLDEYPILEAMAAWYFEHRADPGRDETAMVARSLAIYEYLLAQVHGHEADAWYEDLLAGIGPTVVHLYCAIGRYDRAKFYVHLLDREYKNGRLREEDYLDVIRVYEVILIREREERGELLAGEEGEFRRINKICWETISARDRHIEALSVENARLAERLAREASPALFAKATEWLSSAFGSSSESLNADTRRLLELAHVFTQEPFRSSWFGALPSYTYLAVKSELLGRLQKHCLNAECSEVLKADPIKLLLGFGNKRHSPVDRDVIKRILTAAFGGRFNLSRHNLEILLLLKTHRDQAEHPEDNPVYGMEQHSILHKEVWASGWLTRFLDSLL